MLALFQKRIEGDDALLELAGLRFRKAGLGAELQAETVAELHHLLRFAPGPEAPVVVHLSRDIDLFNTESHWLILDFAGSFQDRVYGFVLHDQAAIQTGLDEYATLLAEMDRGLHSSLPSRPYLFIEYAVGLEPALFCELFRKIANLKQISACIDIGHLGIRQVRESFCQLHPDRDVCALTPSTPDLPELIADVRTAVDNALPAVLGTVRSLAGLGKSLHFHLHDGHPLSTSSPFGVSDHLSFFDEIPLPFPFADKKALPLMFGPAGLAQIVAATLESLAPELLSFTLEIHPTHGRLPLGDAAHLFAHWQDKTNAEWMHYWLAVLLQNHHLLQQAVRDSTTENNEARRK